MKKIMPIAEAFHMHSASKNLGRKLYAIKVTPAQAYAFKSGFKDFSSMAAKYGWENKLTEGENYEGYLAVYYSADMQMIVYLDGALYKVAPDEEVSPEDLEAQSKQSLWKAVTGVDEDEEGTFEYVFTLGDYRLAQLVQDMQTYDGILRSMSPVLLSESIKAKLIAALQNETFAELSDAEAVTLEKCFGKGCALFAEV